MPDGRRFAVILIIAAMLVVIFGCWLRQNGCTTLRAEETARGPPDAGRVGSQGD